MKKLLVLALAAVLVFAMAAVSMAAVAVTGEINVGLNLAPEGTKGQASDAKLVFDAAINDSVSVNAAIKGSVTTPSNLGETPADVQTTTLGLDTYSISNKFDMGTLKLGYFGANLNGKKDILSVPIGEIKPASLIEFAAKVGEGMTATIDYDYLTEAAYVASFTYDVAPLYVQVGMAKQGDASGTALNVGYAVGDALTAYLVYQTVADTEEKATLVGVNYVKDALSARFEYDTQKVADEAQMGIKVGYTAANSLVYTLSYVKDDGAADASTAVKVTAKF